MVVSEGDDDVKKMVQLFLVAMAVCLLAAVNPVQAAEKKDEWRDIKFDFSKMKVVSLEIQFDDKLSRDAVRDLKLSDAIDNLLVRDSQEKLRMARYAIVKHEPDKPLAYDAKLIVFIRQYGEKEVWVPESRQLVTTNQVIESEEITYDRNGQAIKTIKKITIPVTKEVYTPAHYETWTTAGIELQLLDPDGKPVWQLIDLRDSSDRHNPFSMCERILKRCVDKLVELKSK